MSVSARTGLSLAERSDLVADVVEIAMNSRPATKRLRDAVRILAERTLQVQDDHNLRSNGKIPTWTRIRTVKNGVGQTVTEITLNEDARRKMVAATIGSMLVADKRETRTWVLDAVDEAIGLLPWKART